MMNNILDFEKPIFELNTKIEELKKFHAVSQTTNIAEEIIDYEKKLKLLISNTYRNLNAWDITQIARHLNRPRTLDYINNIFTNFIEFHGDRHYADDKSIIGGLAKFLEQSVMVVGHQKGKDTRENIERNFGMPRPEGYRKALRLMKLAEKFMIPVITFIDTPGAYPGIGAEERNQSEAIGKNIYEMSILRTPIITNIIGEGGSGGALALAVADQINMLEYSIYSVISPEGCASILWKDANKASEAAEILGITSTRLKSLNLIDNIIQEPIAGAHTNHEETLLKIKNMIKLNLKKLNDINIDDLVKKRFNRIIKFGKFSEELE